MTLNTRLHACAQKDENSPWTLLEVQVELR